MWDSFECHISEPTKDALKRAKIKSAVVPGGCAKYIQAQGVCWNKPLKDMIRASYGLWMESGQETYTAAGNPRAPPLDVVVG